MADRRSVSVPMMPAVCDRCGLVSSSGFFVDNSTSISVTGYSALCPCGGTARIQDGSYDVLEGRISLASALSSLRRDDLMELRSRLERLESAGAGTDEVATEVSTVAPGLGEWLKNPENRGRDSIVILLMVVQTLLSLLTYRATNTPTSADVQQVVIQIEGGEDSNPPLPRRAPCWCGSEKRYKNCHGRGAPEPDPLRRSP